MFCQVIVFSQTEKTYSVFNLRNITLKLDSSLKEYASTVAHSLSNNRELDSMASLRVKYYLNLIKYNSTNIKIANLYNKIPLGEIAHNRWFGLPNLFKEAPETVFPNSLGSINELKIKAEILQESMTTKYSKFEMNDDEISQVALKKMFTAHGSNYIIEGYQKSPSHNEIILKYGNGNYGTSTMALLSKYYNKPNQEWEYEFFVMNCTVFTNGQ